MRKVVFITGASRGLGKAMALAFSKQNYRVVVHYNRAETEALEIVKTITNLNQEAIAVQASLNDPKSINTAVQKVIDVYGQIDVLINNAGIKDDAPILDMSLETFSEVMSVNVTGAWLITKAVSQIMINQSSGRIINISSGVGTYGRENQTNYAGSKGALNAITKSLSKELGSYNITVNAIAPGLIETDMTSNIDAKHKEAYRQQIPLKRLGKPEDIANAAVFLASDNASFISGQVLHVNGGLR